MIVKAKQSTLDDFAKKPAPKKAAPKPKAKPIEIPDVSDESDYIIRKPTPAAKTKYPSDDEVEVKPKVKAKPKPKAKVASSDDESDVPVKAKAKKGAKRPASDFEE